MDKQSKKHGIAVVGTWVPLPLDVLKSRAFAELSPLAMKLLMDMIASLGPNANGNGDISIAPKLMIVRGWNSRSSLRAAAVELEENGLIIKSRQGSRLDCSLFAITFYTLKCDKDKIDILSSAYSISDYMGKDLSLGLPPTATKPAKWRRPRKGELKRVAPPRYKVASDRPATVQTCEAIN